MPPHPDLEAVNMETMNLIFEKKAKEEKILLTSFSL
jgi:hypothetical protein